MPSFVRGRCLVDLDVPSAHSENRHSLVTPDGSANAPSFQLLVNDSCGLVSEIQTANIVFTTPISTGGVNVGSAGSSSAGSMTGSTGVSIGTGSSNTAGSIISNNTNSAGASGNTSFINSTIGYSIIGAGAIAASCLFFFGLRRYCFTQKTETSPQAMEENAEKIDTAVKSKVEVAPPNKFASGTAYMGDVAQIELTDVKEGSESERKKQGSVH